MAKKTNEKRYTPRALIKGGRYAGYQKDFLAVILTKPLYTLAEADKAVREFFGKDVT